MRRIAASLVCALCAGLAAGAAPAGDLWGGRYRLEWVPELALPSASVVLARMPDADPAKVPEKYRGDLARWSLAGADEPADTTVLRRFLPAEYAQWGWKDLYATGQIECLDASRLFVCKTAPGSAVKFGPDAPAQETLRARTGLFGIVLHAGAFELKKE